MITSCAWCLALQADPRWPDCSCRTLCQSARCLPSFPAADVQPGMAIHHPHGCSEADGGVTSGVLDVLAVAGPDDEGFMHLSGIHETVRVAADWPVTLYTREDADLVASLLMEATGTGGTS